MIRHLFVLITAFLVALPFLWMAFAAFIPQEIVYSGELLSRFGFTLANFQVLAKEGFWGRMGFSLAVSSLVTFLQLFTAFLAAYAIKEGLKVLPFFLLLLAVPAELLLVPLYGLLKSLHLLDTVWALILPFAASPFIVFLLYGAMRSIPEELLEAARLDGAGHRVLLSRILFPLMRPTLVAAGVLAFAAH